MSIDPHLIQTIRSRVAALTAEVGVAEASRRLDVRREVLLRLAAGTQVREGSLLLVAQRLGLLAAMPTIINKGPTFTA